MLLATKVNSIYTQQRDKSWLSMVGKRHQKWRHSWWFDVIIWYIGLDRLRLVATQSLFSAGDRQLNVVGEIPLIFDVCLLYYENRQKNMRYRVLSPVVKETGVGMWGKSGFHDPAKPGRELSWDIYPQRQDCFIIKTDMKIKANFIALELSLHFLIICNMSAITQVVKYLSSCLHCATQHYWLKSPAVK